MDNHKREVQFHIGLSREDQVGRYCIRPGSPGRMQYRPTRSSLLSPI